MDFPSLRRAGRTSTGGVLSSDHQLYHRQALRPVPPFQHHAGTPYAFLVRHDLGRCWPFGVFDVYVSTPARLNVHVGSQLSYPTPSDCGRLLRLAREGAARHLPAPTSHPGGAHVQLPHTVKGR